MAIDNIDSQDIVMGFEIDIGLTEGEESSRKEVALGILESLAIRTDALDKRDHGFIKVRNLLATHNYTHFDFDRGAYFIEEKGRVVLRVYQQQSEESSNL